MTKFTIAVTSDMVCPWCYVGKKRLQVAITRWRDLHPESKDDFEVTYKSFALNPQAPNVGIEKDVYLARRYPLEQLKQGRVRLNSIGKSLGIDFKWSGKTGNTRDSHRLLQLGKTKGPEVAERVLSNIMRGYFENERDITSKDFLTEAGVDAGLDSAEVKHWLSSDGGGPEVDKQMEEARRNFITGVPEFTINGRYHLHGAQETETFLKVFENIQEAGETA